MNISDTVRIYLRNSSSPYNIVDSAKSVVDAATLTGSFLFINAPAGTYYLQVKGRNCIETGSKSGGESYDPASVLNYDFTDLKTKAFGSNQIQIDNPPEVFAFYGGDVNQDGVIDLWDITNTYNAANTFATGYIATDINGDNTFDLDDILITFNNANAFVEAERP